MLLDARFIFLGFLVESRNMKKKRRGERVYDEERVTKKPRFWESSLDHSVLAFPGLVWAFLLFVIIIFSRPKVK